MKKRSVFFSLFLAGIFIALATGRFASAQSKSDAVKINKVEDAKKGVSGISPDKSSDFLSTDEEGVSPDDANAYGNYQDPASTSLPNPVFAFLRSLVSLVFILALVYLSIYGLKMFMSKKPGFTFSSGIKVLESTFLSQNKSLHLVEVGGEMLLLGVTDGGMSVLKEIKDPMSINMLRSKMGAAPKKSPSSTHPSAQGASARQAADSFKEVFKSAAENFKTKDTKISDVLPQDTPPPSQHEEKIRNSLNVLRKELEKIQEIRKKEIS